MGQKAKDDFLIPQGMSSFVPNRNPELDVGYTRSGFYNINRVFKLLNQAEIPNQLEGIVILSPSFPIKYKIKSHNLNKENGGYYENFCVYVRVPVLDEGTKPNPEIHMNKYCKFNVTDEEKNALKFLYMNDVSCHDLVAPLYEGQQKPIVGQHVRVHYYNSLVDNGERIKGFYEIINNNNSKFQLLTDAKREFIQRLTELEGINNSIVDLTDSEVSKPSSESQIFQNCNPEQENCKVKIVSAQTRAFYQGASPWGQQKIGNSNNTIAKVGCLITCYTMAHNWLLKPSIELTPLDTYNKAIEYQTKNPGFEMFRSSGAIKGDLPGLILNLKLNGSWRNDDDRTKLRDLDNLRSYIDSALDEGNILIFHVDYKNSKTGEAKNDLEGDHFIMCYKRDEEGNYICNDPQYGKAFILNRQRLTSGLPTDKETNSNYYVVNARKVSKNI